ncbi:MAG: MogA/MoaB family molybdenum cofactor biosynthesis protein [Chloroflexota bacterium]|jgi:molybdenum cofactor synthesis domain-containing protein
MIRVAILTISDRSARGEREDLSGPALAEKAIAVGFEIVNSATVPDNFAQICKTLIQWCDQDECDIILTTGGTGVAPSDLTPEATLAIIDKSVPGIPEAMRANSLKITPHAMLTRLVAGIRKQTLIVNLPGSPKGAVENLEVVLPTLPHAVELIRNDPRAESGHKKIFQTD